MIAQKGVIADIPEFAGVVFRMARLSRFVRSAPEEDAKAVILQGVVDNIAMDAVFCGNAGLVIPDQGVPLESGP